MTIRWLRLILGVIIAEVVPIVLLIVILAIMAPAADQAEDVASNLGAWVGPIGGALATFLMAWWVARPLPEGHVHHGVLLGVGVALLDAGLLVVGATGFAWLFVASGMGRIVAGTMGGYVASKRVPSA